MQYYYFSSAKPIADSKFVRAICKFRNWFGIFDIANKIHHQLRKHHSLYVYPLLCIILIFWACQLGHNYKCDKIMSCPNASIFLDFGYDSYFMISLFKFQDDKNNFTKVYKRTSKDTLIFSSWKNWIILYYTKNINCIWSQKKWRIRT